MRTNKSCNVNMFLISIECYHMNPHDAAYDLKLYIGVHSLII